MSAVATTTGKDVHITFRINPKVREDFKIAADLRGASMSGLIHQFIVKTIREEKASNPDAFKKHSPTIEDEVLPIIDTRVAPAGPQHPADVTDISKRGGKKRK